MWKRGKPRPFEMVFLPSGLVVGVVLLVVGHGRVHSAGLYLTIYCGALSLAVLLRWTTAGQRPDESTIQRWRRERRERPMR